jgi:hypothetical protein
MDLVPETARLACVIDQWADDHLSHAGYRTVEAAEALDELYPEQAARLWRALGLAIVNTGKSKQYTAAVEYFGRAKRSFAVAGLARGPGAREPLPQGRLYPRVREGRHGSDSWT